MENLTTILIVDDERIGREALEGALFSQGYNLVFAENGQEAYQKALEYTPDLILLDVMMPGEDGFSVCRQLREDALLADIPVLLITALDDRSSRLKGIEAGADDFITKPFDRIELRARVRTITRLNRYRRILQEKARFVWVVDQTPDGYLMLNTANQIVYTNPAARAMLSLPDPDQGSIQCLFHEWVSRRYSLEPEELWERWRQQIHPEIPIYLIRRETSHSETVWLQVTVLNMPWGEEGSILVRITDISNLVIMRQEMWNFNSIIAHKLRAPVTNMLLSAELMTLIARRQRINEMVELAATMSMGVNRLRGEIDDILGYVYAPVESNTGSFLQTSQIKQMVDSLAAELQIENLQVFVADSAASSTISLSSRSMEVILLEVMENSKKFHPNQNPAIVVTASLDARHRLVLRIVDDGVTLSPQQMQQAWLPYYQGEKLLTGEIAGMGLGLSTVASLVWGAGGKYRMLNREDCQGTVVEFVLPLCEESCF